jgi:hypothetical protein
MIKMRKPTGSSIQRGPRPYAHRDRKMGANPTKIDSSLRRHADLFDGDLATAHGGAALTGGRRTMLATATTPTTVLSAGGPAAVLPIRTSQVLREILTKNPSVKNFTVKQIVDSIGDNRVGASLIFFSIPGMLPVPGTSNLVGIPTGVIAGQMIAGRGQFKLPQFILERSVPRRSLTVAIQAMLPILEMAEKVAKPRWQWASHPAAQRLLGVFIFLLALAIACPILGFNAPHAAAIFIISLGLVERDGLAILIGIVVGLASLVFLTGVGLSGEALRSRAGRWAKGLSKKFSLKWATQLGLKWAARFLKKFGFRWSMLLLFEWTQLFFLRDPVWSRPAEGKKSRRTVVTGKQKGSVVRRSRTLAQLPALRSHLRTADGSPASKYAAMPARR